MDKKALQLEVKTKEMRLQCHGFRGRDGWWLVGAGIGGMFTALSSAPSWWIVGAFGAVVALWWIPYIDRSLRVMVGWLVLLISLFAIAAMGKRVLSAKVDGGGVSLQATGIGRKAWFSRWICHVSPTIVLVVFLLVFGQQPGVNVAVSAISSALLCYGVGVLRAEEKRSKSDKQSTMANLLNIKLSLLGHPLLPGDLQICFFSRDRKDFPFLSNFYPAKFELDGQCWPNVEVYYQAQKSMNPEYREKIRKRDSPRWAKFVGDSRIGDPKISKTSWFRRRPEDLRADWDECKTGVMRRAVFAKFEQNEGLAKSLLATESARLVEDSPKDSYWGIGFDGKGQNQLGKILEEVREAINTDKVETEEYGK